MKTIAAVVSALAVVNLMALLVAAGWLWQSDRLSPQRLEAVREIFALTNAEQAAREEEAAQEAERQAQLAEEAQRANRPPLTADEQLTSLRYVNEQAELGIERARQELAILQKSLANEQAALSRERAELEADKLAFAQMQQEIRDARESNQFEQALTIYQGLDAPAVKDLWLRLIERGEMEQVITYLGAMQARKATEVIGEFEKEDPTLAAELLERLRTHGLPVASSEERQ